jgi:hypothetical protein
MIDVTNILLMNIGVSSLVLFVLFLWWMAKPNEKREERIYLNKEMYKIKDNVSDSEADI